MTLTHIANLLDPLQTAIVMQSWEDAEDIAREISRLCRLKRLSELQKIQEALEGRRTDKSPPMPLPAPNLLDVVSLETHFDEKGHDEVWRNQVAQELNLLLAYARGSIFQHFRGVTISLVARIAQFEEIKAL